MNVARLVAIVALALVAYEGRRLFSNVFNPLTWYCLPFMLILTYQQVWLPSLPFGARASILLVGSAVAFLAGAVVGQSAGRRRQPKLAVLRPRVDVKVLLLVALGFIGCALLNLYLVRQQVGAGRGVEAGLFYRQRFYSEAQNSGTLRLLQAVTYAGAFYLAAAFRIIPRGRWLIAAFLGITFLQGIVVSTKASTLIVTLIVVVTALTVRETAERKWRAKSLVPALLVTWIVVGTFSVITNQRSQGTADVGATLEYALAGGPSALSLVLEGEAPLRIDAPFGLTVGGLQETLGLNNRRFGIYDDVVLLQPGVPESLTNIYTWFVPLQHDFGLAGSLVVVLGLGLVAGALAGRLRSGWLDVQGRCALALLNCVLAFAPITALTYYNFVWLLAAFVPIIGMLMHFSASGDVPSRRGFIRTPEISPGLPPRRTARRA